VGAYNKSDVGILLSIVTDKMVIAQEGGATFIFIPVFKVKPPSGEPQDGFFVGGLIFLYGRYFVSDVLVALISTFSGENFISSMNSFLVLSESTIAMWT
jgi:hypothetical protein